MARPLSPSCSRFEEGYKSVMEKRMFAVLAAISLPLLANELLAQNEPIPNILTLEQTIELALRRNPTLMAARNSIEMAEADVVSAGLHPNPAVTFESESYPYFRSNPGPFFSNQEITARFDYEIQTKHRLKLGAEAAEVSIRKEAAMLEDTARRLRLEVRVAFYRVLLAESNRQLARAILDQTDQVIALNRTRFEEGEISGLELTRIEVERLRFADDLFQVRLESQNAKASLLALLNAPDLGADLQVRGDLNEMPYLGISLAATDAEVLRMANDQRPDMRAAMAEIERSSAQNRLQRAIASPNITVGGGYKRDGPDHSLVAGITVPLNIFDRNQGEILRSEAEMRQAANLFAEVRNRVALEVRQAYNAVQINRERVEYIRTQQVQQAEEASRVTLAAYRLGGAPLMNYLDAQRRYRDTMRVLNQAVFDECVSMFALAAAIGEGQQQ